MMAIRSIKNALRFTTQTFVFSWTRVQSWQNGQIDIFEKNQKNFFLDDCDGFFSCLWSTAIRLIKK